MGVVFPRRIRLRHFQYRSPAQIQLRLDTRRRAAEQGYLHFGHSLENNWQEKLVSSGSLNLETDVSSLETLRVQSEIPNHLEVFRHRLVKRFLHGSGIWP